MNLQPGQKLSHYRLVEKIGEGGMGVVWKATDTTLDRDVAIKVLPEDFAAEPERLARFEREARLLASLNHPNIAGVYGLHEDQGTHFLAMELVPGEDLARRLERGPLSQSQTLNIALQVADALETAHENGIIHRDLKPANIHLDLDGNAKVLDFGLAKVLTPDMPDDPGSISLSPTLTAAGTLAGIILGTAAYMSPEQAKGKAVDRRADIWSFGVVLYEMLASRRLFTGETASETMAAVMMQEIDLKEVHEETPAAVARLLARCLERDPRLRLRDMGEARISLADAIEDPGAGIGLREPEPAAAPRPFVLRALPWSLAALSLAGLVLVLALPRSTPPPGPVMRLALSGFDGARLRVSPRPVMDLSRDGQRLVFAGETEQGENSLHLRYLNQMTSTPLPGTEGAAVPFFSPDGDWVAFAQDDKLKKISILGGPPLTLCDAPGFRGGTWSDDDVIVFAPQSRSGLYRVAAAGGTPEPLTNLQSTTTPSENSSDLSSIATHRWPAFLPDGQHVLYTDADDNDDYANAVIKVLSLEDLSTKVILRGGTFPRFAASGHLVFARDRTLYAAPFDPEALETTGPAVPVLEGLAGGVNWGCLQCTMSREGTLIYLPAGGGAGKMEMVWLDREGTATPASGLTRGFQRASLSPDGKAVAVSISDGDISSIWVLDFTRDNLTRFTFGDQVDISPVWSPDGQWIAFSRQVKGGNFEIFRQRANGDGEAERLTDSPDFDRPESWSPDSRTLIYQARRPGSNDSDILLLRLEGEPSSETFLDTSFSEGDAHISPDGRWVAYISNETGDPEIYVRRLAGTGGGRVKVSTTGGISPLWAPDNKELIYRDLDNNLMSVDFTSSADTFTPTAPRQLLELLPWDRGPEVIAADERGILILRPVGSATADTWDPVVVVNWLTELNRVTQGTRSGP